MAWDISTSDCGLTSPSSKDQAADSLITDLERALMGKEDFRSFELNRPVNISLDLPSEALYRLKQDVTKKIESYHPKKLSFYKDASESLSNTNLFEISSVNKNSYTKEVSFEWELTDLPQGCSHPQSEDFKPRKGQNAV